MSLLGDNGVECRETATPDHDLMPQANGVCAFRAPSLKAAGRTWPAGQRWRARAHGAGAPCPHQVRRSAHKRPGSIAFVLAHSFCG